MNNTGSILSAVGRFLKNYKLVKKTSAVLACAGIITTILVYHTGPFISNMAIDIMLDCSRFLIMTSLAMIVIGVIIRLKSENSIKINDTSDKVAAADTGKDDIELHENNTGEEKEKTDKPEKDGCLKLAGIALYVCVAIYVSIYTEKAFWRAVVFFAIIGFFLFAPYKHKIRILEVAAKMIKYSFSKTLPKWLKLLNACVLFPILLLPLTLSAFLFIDYDPDGTGFLFVCAVNTYPVFLLLIAYFNSKLFQKNKILGYISSACIFFALMTGIFYAIL